jgi:hypothetical protein
MDGYEIYKNTEILAILYVEIANICEYAIPREVRLSSRLRYLHEMLERPPRKSLQELVK